MTCWRRRQVIVVMPWGTILFKWTNNLLVIIQMSCSLTLLRKEITTITTATQGIKIILVWFHNCHRIVIIIIIIRICNRHSINTMLNSHSNSSNHTPTRMVTVSTRIRIVWVKSVEVNMARNQAVQGNHRNRYTVALIYTKHSHSNRIIISQR